ncbi:TICRR protein, partial [Centropus bengalensis]|nr:TICRR protein [Centropus bengalensis]
PAVTEGGMKILEPCSSKVLNILGEFELEGVCRLQDQTSPSDTETRAEEDSDKGTTGLKSQKRVFAYLSPEKEENHDPKRCCTDSRNLDLPGLSKDESNRSTGGMDSQLSEKPGACVLVTPEQHSCVGDDNVFLSSGSTPPLKSTLSASSLLALTQSPLLCQGQTPPSRRKRVRALIHSFCFAEEESNAFQVTAKQDLSPFPIRASTKRPLSRTYSRKRLLS